MTYETIAATAHRLMVRACVRVDILRVPPATAHELERGAWVSALSSHTFRPPSLGEPGPIGLRMVIDDGLPPGAWRLCDEDGTLLYDNREGTSALGG